jgi:L-2-hydroxycarboxylate dehydrogenase (NAD+)
MKLTIQELKELCLPILTKQGLSQEDAEIIFAEYLDGELRGRECHGFAFFKKFGAKLVDSSAKEEVLKDEDNLIFIDGGGKLGQLVCNKYVPRLIEKAKSKSIAMMGIKNMHSYLMPGTYARMIAENDLVGFIFNYGGKARIAPTGSIDPMLATNPIAVGIPSNNLPIVIDLATSKTAMGKVRLAEKLGLELEPDCCIDKDGKPTINPEKAMEGAIFPFGGYKGYSMALMVEVLSKTMFGLGGCKENVGKRGFFFMAINPAAFQDINEFKENVSKLISEIKSARKAEGIKEIFVPGERSERLKQENLKKGYLEIDDQIINEIKEMV